MTGKRPSRDPYEAPEAPVYSGVLRIVVPMRPWLIGVGAFSLYNAAFFCCSPLSVLNYTLITQYQAQLMDQAVDPIPWLRFATFAVPAMGAAVSGVFLGVSALRQARAIRGMRDAPSVDGLNRLLQLHRNVWTGVGVTVIATPVVLVALWAMEI